MGQNTNQKAKDESIGAIQIRPFEMGFWLDSYDDLFSDFDPRPYSRRQISDDFLIELRRRFKEKPRGGIEISIYLPRAKRDSKIESSARKKMREYFGFERERLEKRQLGRKKTGVMYLAAGIFILILNAYIEWEFEPNRFLTLVGFMLAPVGWFSAWTSFERFLINPPEEMEKQEFFTRMQRCDFAFFDLENAERDYAESVEPKIIVKAAASVKTIGSSK